MFYLFFLNICRALLHQWPPVCAAVRIRSDEMDVPFLQQLQQVFLDIPSVSSDHAPGVHLNIGTHPDQLFHIFFNQKGVIPFDMS